MNCQLCQKELDAYRDGKLSPDMRIEVESHLMHCIDCEDFYIMQLLTESVSREKAINPDVYLTERIMSRIVRSDKQDCRIVAPITRFFKPALIITSAAAALFAGVIIGDLYKPVSSKKSIPIELALINDSVIEAVDGLSNE